MDGELERECSQRLQKLRDAMRANDLDVCLVYTRGKREMLRMDAIRYLVGCASLGTHALLMVEHDETPVLYVLPASASEVVRDQSAGCDVIGVDDLAQGVTQRLNGQRRPARRIALVGREIMPAVLFEEMVEAIPGTFEVHDDLLKEVARRKSSWEIERIERAQSMADRGFAVLHEVARPGLREFELAAELERALRLAGASDNFGLLAASQHNQAIRLPTERALEPGDIIIAEITPECDGYFAQLCRTIVLGPVSDTLAKKFELLRTSFERGLEAVKPGARVGEVARSVNEVLRDAGYEEYCKPPYMRSRGHGLGQGSALPGDLNETNDAKLEEGMTFIIHPNQYLPETGYLMLGETCVVSSRAGRSFSSVERTLFSTQVG